MKLSRSFVPTKKKPPADTGSEVYGLLHRAGFVRQTASGIHTWLPMGQRVINRICSLVGEIFDKYGALEVNTPVLLPANTEKIGGSSCKDKEFKVKDKTGREYHVGKDPAEPLLGMLEAERPSYKDLPLIFYRQGQKLTDVEKPTSSLLDARAKITMEAAGFFADRKSARDFVNDVRIDVEAVLKRIGLDAVAAADIVEGKPKIIYVIKSGEGNQRVLMCRGCEYKATRRAAKRFHPSPDESQKEPGEPYQKVNTPGVTSIEKLRKFLDIKGKELIKAMVCVADGRPVMALVRGDRDLNESKLKEALSVNELRMATADEIEDFTGGEAGFSGPVGINAERVVADFEIKDMTSAVTGANEADCHLINVKPGVDFKPSGYYDLRFAEKGDMCPQCNGRMKIITAGEAVGVFLPDFVKNVGSNAVYLDEDGKRKSYCLVRLCFDVTSIISLIAEKHHDRDGLMWPASVAPFDTVVIPVFSDNPGMMEAAEQLCLDLITRGINALLEDRDRKPGFKFKDADLMGFPVIVIIGKLAESHGLYEMKIRRKNGKVRISSEEIVFDISREIDDDHSLPVQIEEEYV